VRLRWFVNASRTIERAATENVLQGLKQSLVKEGRFLDVSHAGSAKPRLFYGRPRQSCVLYHKLEVSVFSISWT